MERTERSFEKNKILHFSVYKCDPSVSVVESTNWMRIGVQLKEEPETRFLNNCHAKCT